MLQKIIDYLENKLKIRKIDIPRTESEAVMLDLEETFKVLMSVEGMDEELANRVVNKLGELMEE